MEVAGQIVLLNEGRVEQVGSPRELYESPANEFVMTFVGPVNRLGETFVRPHDVAVPEAAVLDEHPAVDAARRRGEVFARGAGDVGAELSLRAHGHPRKATHCKGNLTRASRAGLSA